MVPLISGKIALGGMSLEFGNAEERFQALSTELDTLTDRERHLLEKEEGIIEDLARLYLPELSSDSVSSGISELRTVMAAALAARATHRGELEERLDELPETIARLELLLAEAERSEEIAAQGIRDVRTLVEQALDGADGGAHSAAVAEHRALMDRRSILTARRLRLHTTASAEKRRYDEDKAFAYLRGRHFDEPEYRRGFITKRIDGWLARRIDYRRLVRNYSILDRGPQLMQLELRDITDRAKRLESTLDAQESEVGTRHGLQSALAAGAAAQKALLDARVALTDARSRYDRLAGEIRAVDASRGRPWEEALEKHEEFLATRTMSELVELARSTPDPKDDGLVSRLETVRADLVQVGRALLEARERMESMNNRVTGLGDLLRRASAHFTSRRSYFPEQARVSKLVSAVAEGTTDANAAFEELSSVHVREPLLKPRAPGDFDGWFADLSSQFDLELGAVEVRHEHGSADESQVVVYDNHGRVLHRRVSRRSHESR